MSFLIGAIVGLVVGVFLCGAGILTVPKLLAFFVELRSKIESKSSTVDTTPTVTPVVTPSVTPTVV